MHELIRATGDHPEKIYRAIRAGKLKAYDVEVDGKSVKAVTEEALADWMGPEGELAARAHVIAMLFYRWRAEIKGASGGDMDKEIEAMDRAYRQNIRNKERLLALLREL